LKPFIALVSCIIFAHWLLRNDVSYRERMSRALWIPLLWLFIYSTRPLGAWLGMGGGGETDLDGSPLDASVVFTLIIAAFFVLKKRLFPFGKMTGLNVPFFVLLGYFAISILWAPYSFVAFKRWFKEFGHVLVVLLVLTDPDPVKAFKVLCLRLASLLFPLSIVLYKFYPEWGRAYSHGGEAMLTGVTPQKNSLGQICCFYGFVLVWDMVDSYRNRGSNSFWKAIGPKFIVFAIGLGLLIECKSKTSLLAFVVGILIFFSTKVGFIRRVAPSFAKVVFLITCLVLLTSGVWTFAIAPLLEAVGRDATFTERTIIWEKALRQDINRLTGSGFYSFWLDKGESIWAEFQGGFRPRTVHSGYLETYLDGGIIGGVLLAIFLIFTSWRAAARFSHASSLSRVLFAMIVMALTINFSETCLFRLNLLWFSLVLAALASHPMIFRMDSTNMESPSRIPAS
jgi:exopolysaccharide production protein ExoQ